MKVGNETNAATVAWIQMLMVDFQQLMLLKDLETLYPKKKFLIEVQVVLENVMVVMMLHKVVVAMDKVTILVVVEKVLFLLG